MEAIKVVSQPIQSMYGPTKDKPMMKFKDDKGIEFAVFKPELFDLIKEGTTIQAEVQVKESTNPNYPDNHNIINIFQEGKPAIQKENKGRPAFTKDTASIEQQVAIKEIGECLRVGLETPEWAKKNYWNWIETHTTNREQPPNAPQSTPAAPKVEKPVIVPPAEKPAPMNAMTAETIKTLSKDSDKYGIMYATAKDKGWTKGKPNWSSKDLTQSQATTLIGMFSE